MAQKLKEARVLVNIIIGGVSYEPDQVIKANEALIETYKNQGSLDDHPEAVNYCLKKLKSKTILHKDVSGEDAEANAKAELEAQEKAAAEAKVKAEAIDALNSEIQATQEKLAAASDDDKPALQEKFESLNKELAALG